MKTACFLACLLLLAGCGDNLTPNSGDVSVYQPQDLSALSFDSTAVALRWGQSLTAKDTLLGGYIVQYGGFLDTVGSGVTSYLAGGLPPGAMTFSVSALLKDGRKSPLTSIDWAPAKRFPQVFQLLEYDISHSDSLSALHVGSQTTNPYRVAVLALFQSVLDFYVQGIAGDALRLRSAVRYSQSWRTAWISSVSDSATSLDYFRETFPAAETFNLYEILLQDNHIYYVRVQGDNPGDWNYARLQIHLLGGVYPNRTVQVQISLQRVAWVPFA